MGIITFLKSLYEPPKRQQHIAQFDEMLRIQSLDPRFTVSKLGAMIIATIIHVQTLCFVALGIAVGLSGGGLFIYLLALFFLGIAWVVRPRLGKKPVGHIKANTVV